MEQESIYTDASGAQYIYGTGKNLLKHVPSGLDGYTIMDGCTAIDLQAFSECRTLRELTLPRSITRLSKGVFDGCPDLYKLTLFCEEHFSAERHRGDSGWGFEFFLEEYPNVKEIHIVPWSILADSIHEYEVPHLLIKNIDRERLNLVEENDCIYNSDKTVLISDGSGQVSIKILEGVKRICASAFENNLNIKELILPESIETIDFETFRRCSGLKKVTVLADRFSSFNVAPNIKEVLVPIGTKPFYDTLKYRYDKFEINELQLDQDPITRQLDGCIYSTNGKELLSGEKSTAQSVRIQNGTEIIADYAFQDNDTLEEVIFPRSVTNIGCRAFMNCKNLKRVILCNKLTGIVIHFDSFMGCRIEELYRPGQIRVKGSDDGELMGFDELEKEYELPDLYTDDIWVDTTTHLIYDESRKKLVFIPKLVGENLVNFTVPHFVEEIHISTFENCQRLESITLPESIKELTGAPFCMCSNLKNIYVHNSLFKDFDGVLYTVDKRELISYPPKRYIEKYEIEGGIAKIRDYAFANHYELRIISFPDSLISIGDWAFGGTGLKTIVFPEKLEVIGANAFNSNPLIKTVFTGKSIEIIGSDAFKPLVYKGEAETWVPLKTKAFFEGKGKNSFMYDIVEKESYELAEVQSAIEQQFKPAQKGKLKEEFVIPDTPSTKESSKNQGCLGVLITFIFIVAFYLL